MKCSVLIGSHARGDANQYSDCDVLLIGMDESEFDEETLPSTAREYVNYIKYDDPTFLRLHEIGSLFLYHALYEGVLLSGSTLEWSRAREAFSVQKSFLAELERILKTTNLLSNTSIFGGKYLTPLVNAFIEVKNACIFSLAHQGVYEFNKMRCFERCGFTSGRYARLSELKFFYDYSVRGLTVDLPFDPNDIETCECLLKGANDMARELRNACK